MPDDLAYLIAGQTGANLAVVLRAMATAGTAAEAVTLASLADRIAADGSPHGAS